MAFFASAIALLQSVITAVGVGIGVLGVVHLFEGIQSDNPASKNKEVRKWR